MNISATSTPSTPSTPSIPAVAAVLRVFTATFPRRRREPHPVLAGPQRFGDSYRWPDGSWTFSG